MNGTGQVTSLIATPAYRLRELLQCNSVTDALTAAFGDFRLNVIRQQEASFSPADVQQRFGSGMRDHHLFTREITLSVPWEDGWRNILFARSWISPGRLKRE